MRNVENRGSKYVCLVMRHLSTRDTLDQKNLQLQCMCLMVRLLWVDEYESIKSHSPSCLWYYTE